MPEKAPALATVPKATVKPGTLQRKCACGGTTGSSGMCPACEAKARGLLQRKASNDQALGVPASVDSVLASPGHPLDAGTRATMEGGFGTDLSHVRVHTDGQAAESARAVGAHAYTVGSNIAFAQGQYDPGSPHGQRLLAHEIAHTVQQGGLQRSAATSLEVSPAYSAAEAEADRAAEAVVSGRGAPSISPAALSVARTPDPATDPSPTVTSTPGAVSGTATQPTTPSLTAAETPRSASLVATPPEITESDLRAAGVSGIVAPQGAPSNERIYVVEEFPVPADKGPAALALYSRFAGQDQLRGTIDLSNRSSGFSQARDSTDSLRTSWLQKVGWPTSAALAKQNWIAQGGTNPSPDFRPKAQGHTCHMDHIVELQVTGTNVRDNVQVLDAAPNVASGGSINRFLVDKAQQIQRAYNTPQKPSLITMHFRRAVPGPGATPASPTAGPGPSCIEIETAVMGAGVATAVAAAAPADSDPTVLQYGAQSTTAYLGRTAATNFGTNVALHRNTRQHVPGFLLNVYTRHTDGPDTITADVDGNNLTGRPGTSTVPGAISSAATVTIDQQPRPGFVAEAPGATPAAEGAAPAPAAGLPQKRLRFDRFANDLLRFHYPALSEGELHMAYTEAGGFTGTGTLRPSVPLLRGTTLGLTLGNGRLSATLAAPRRDTRILGARLTRAELAATLIPNLEAQGNLELAWGPASRPTATATVNVTAGARGIEATGEIVANIPQVDNARGTVRYRDGQWTGQVRVESSQIRIPNVTRASLVVDVDARGVRPSGEVVLDVRGNPVTLGVHVEEGRWVFTGAATINVRPLDPVNLSFRYTNGQLTARGNTGFTWRGLRGTVNVLYEEGRFTGDGTLNVTRGPVSGTINAHLLRSGKITGDGTIGYQVTPALRATVGVAIDEADNVRLTGELRFTQPIRLFRQYSGHRNLFRRSLDFPIAGISIGPTSIGLVFRITGALDADWSIGPGEIRNLHLAAQFDPFAENTNLSLMGGGQLFIPASAGFTTSLRGALAVSLVAASVSGGITASARIGIDAAASSDLSFSYANGRYVVDNVARILARPVLNFGLEANVEAEVVGFDPYHQGYTLASYALPSGLEFGAEIPFHYASDEAFQAPRIEDIRLIYPDLDVASIISGMLERVGAL